MPQDILPPAVAEALKSGDKIEAIKRLRGITGLGLKEAKDWIESYERGDQPPAPSPFDSPSEGDRNKPIDLSEAAIQAMQRGDLIPAIKDIRQSTGVGLAEAKAIAEMIQQSLPAEGSVGDRAAMLSRAFHRAKDAPQQRPGQGLAPGQVASGGGVMKWVAVVVIAAAVIAAVIYF